MNFEERIIQLEKKVAELERTVQPNKFIPEDSRGIYTDLTKCSSGEDGQIFKSSEKACTPDGKSLHD